MIPWERPSTCLALMASSLTSTVQLSSSSLSSSLLPFVGDALPLSPKKSQKLKQIAKFTRQNNEVIFRGNYLNFPKYFQHAVKVWGPLINFSTVFLISKTTEKTSNSYTCCEKLFSRKPRQSQQQSPISKFSSRFLTWCDHFHDSFPAL